MKIKKYKSNKKNSNFLNKFYFLLIIMISFNKSELKKTQRNLILNYSEIRITFLKNGYNAFFLLIMIFYQLQSKHKSNIIVILL